MKHEADTRITAVTRHVQIGSTEASAGRIQHHPILPRHSLGKISSCAGENREKGAGHALFNIRRAFMRYRYPPYKLEHTI